MGYVDRVFLPRRIKIIAYNMMAASIFSRDLGKKITYSALAASVFVSVNLLSIRSTGRECATSADRLLHGIIFFICNFVLMIIVASLRDSHDMKPYTLYAKYSFYGTLLFIILSGPDAYALTRYIDHSLLSDRQCPTIRGVAAHGIIFMALIVMMMYFPKDTK